MKYVTKIISCAFLSITAISHAAFNGISDHSRANCLNNESITWDFTQPHRLAVVSFHTADYMNRVGQYKRHRLQTLMIAALSIMVGGTGKF